MCRHILAVSPWLHLAVHAHGAPTQKLISLLNETVPANNNITRDHSGRYCAVQRCKKQFALIRNKGIWLALRRIFQLNNYQLPQPVLSNSVMNYVKKKKKMGPLMLSNSKGIPVTNEKLSSLSFEGHSQYDIFLPNTSGHSCIDGANTKSWSSPFKPWHNSPRITHFHSFFFFFSRQCENLQRCFHLKLYWEKKG